MHQILHTDATGREIISLDYVTVAGISDELFRIKHFQFPAEAIIENVLPGGRLSTSTVPCKRLVKAINNDLIPPPGWEIPDEDDPNTPLLGTVLSCGCYLRRSDAQAVLCDQHLIEVNR